MGREKKSGRIIPAAGEVVNVDARAGPRRRRGAQLGH
jgi:hypothetical protein